MPGLSQTTVGQMIRVLEALQGQEDDYTLPVLSRDELKLELYEEGFEREVLDFGDLYSWDSRKLLPDLYDGNFFVRLRVHKATSVLAKNDYRAQPATNEDTDKGRTILIRLAEYLCWRLDLLPPHLAEFKQAREGLLTCLTLDGYTVVGRKLVFTESAVLDQPQQVALLKQRIKDSKLPNESVILYHYDQGEEFYVQRRWDACIGQWRSFFEQLLRDIAGSTASHRPDVSASLGPMRDVLDYLKEVDFLDQDERTSVGATWGFLSSGSHPGLAAEDKAHLAMAQALAFSQTLVLKFLNWRSNAFKAFSVK